MKQQIKILRSVYETFTIGQIYDVHDERNGDIFAINDNGYCEIMLRNEFEFVEETPTSPEIGERVHVTDGPYEGIEGELVGDTPTAAFILTDGGRVVQVHRLLVATARREGSQQLITDQVIKDLREREERGIETYGETLRTFNGRSSPQDAYEELLDAAQYTKQWILEREALMIYIERLEESVRSRRGDEAQGYLDRWKRQSGVPA